MYKKTIYACYAGYITQAVVNNLAPLLFVLFMSTFAIPLSEIAFLTTFNFLTQLSVDLVSAGIVDQIGYRFSAVAAHVFAAAGLIALAILPQIMPPFAGLLVACILYSIGGGLIEVIISPIVEACPSEDKARAMSLLHSFYCWGSAGVIIISTLMMHVFGKHNWFILPLFWSLLPIVNGIVFTRVPINTLVSDHEHFNIGALLKNKLFLLMAVLMVMAGASELAMSQWASAFAEAGLHVSKEIGDLAGPCMFALLMGSSRLLYSRYGKAENLSKMIRYSAVLCIAAYLLASLSPSAPLALLGCAVCGFSVGIFWPGIFSIASEAMAGGTAMFALLALAGDIGCSLGPTVVGQMAGFFHDSLNIGLLCAVIFPVCLLVCMGFFVSINSSKRKEEKI